MSVSKWIHTSNQYAKHEAYMVTVDNQDADLLEHCYIKFSKCGYKYATLTTKAGTKLHREIANRHGIIAEVIDHIDGDSLNNRKANLRASTVSANLRNNGAAGVSFERGRQRWRAMVGVATPARERDDVSSLVEDFWMVLSYGKRSKLYERNGKAYFEMKFIGPRRATREEAEDDYIELKRKYHDGELGYRLRAEGRQL